MNKKLIRLTESDLHKIVKESVQKILLEDYYRGVHMGISMPKEVLKSKIDACFENGWSVKEIQRAVDWWEHQQRIDYMYKY